MPSVVVGRFYNSTTSQTIKVVCVSVRFKLKAENGCSVLFHADRPEVLRIPSGLRQRNLFQLKSLILAQIERWRHALHMQVER